MKLSIKSPRSLITLGLCFSWLNVVLPCSAASLDLSDYPIWSGVVSSVKPNLLLLIDTSGSMDEKYMPEVINSATSKAGYYNYQCNTLAYNPNTSYTLPVDYTGTSLTSHSYTSSCSQDGYIASHCSSTVNLGTQYYWKYVGPNASSLSWPATGSNACTQSFSSNTTGICSDGSKLTVTSPTNASCSSGSLYWVKVAVGSTEQQNYANWYNYYRSRLMMMKAAVGQVFSKVTDKYRVGLMTIYDTTPTLAIKDFTAATTSDQKPTWFNTLYGLTATNDTPLRTALSRAGQYFAHTNSSTDDPMQYSCQQNFVILTTDGYWNSTGGSDLSSSSLSTNQDGIIAELAATDSSVLVSPRPVYDGANQTYTIYRYYEEYARPSSTSSCVLSTQAQERDTQYYICSNPSKKNGKYSCGGTWTPGLCTNTSSSSLPVCQSVIGSWYNVSSCTSSSQGSNGKQVDCQNVSAYGYRTQYQYKVTQTSYAGPGGTTALSNETTYSGPSSWADYPGDTTCYATAAATVIPGSTQANTWVEIKGGSSPTVPGTCSSGSQTYECEVIGTGGTTSASITIAVNSTPDTDGYYVVTATSSSAMSYFLVGQMVNITGVTSGYDGDHQILSIAANSKSFTYKVVANPTLSSTGGTATLFAGSSNTLSDVAQYYYKTDLRTSTLGNCNGALGLDVCTNNVPNNKTSKTPEDDKASWQHMVTFTMGLGVNGMVSYSSTYKQDTHIQGLLDYPAIKAGVANWPVPDASTDDGRKIDDLWHAAVDGRGTYYSVNNATDVAAGLSQALSSISASIGSGAGAATQSSQNYTGGTNYAYMGSYKTLEWWGDVSAYPMDDQGNISATSVWSAADRLDTSASKVYSYCDNRMIYLFRSGATSNLVNFSLNTYTCNSSGVAAGTADTGLSSSEQTNFGSTQVQALSQYSVMTTTQRAAVTSDKLVNYVRGQRGYEGFSTANGTTSTNTLFRTRTHVLGDIVDSLPVYVGAPLGKYTDTGYLAFKAANSSRTAQVYVAANDGMLHAFNAASGDETWAIIPSAALPSLYQLASENYGNNHSFILDGSPVVNDVYDKTCSSPNAQDCWKTVLVAGFNKGSSGYYAIDVTNPTSPKGLWEFKYSSTCASVNSVTKQPTADTYADCHLGYSYGNPIIGKMADGTWAVFITSGYNNDDGQGYLYVLDIISGKILYRIGTGVGSSSTQSGLSRINGWVDNGTTDNTITRIYGGDLLGNIWRFDVNNTLAPTGREAILLATATDSSGVAQPITTKPELALVDGMPFIYVGTGKFLGSSDVSTTQTQTIWAIKDSLGTPSTTGTALVANLRSTLGQRILKVDSSDATKRDITAATGSSCQPGVGWYIDLIDTGERINIDPRVISGTLDFYSNVPQSSACTTGGYAWHNYINYKTGCSLSTSSNNQASQKIVNSNGSMSLVSGVTYVGLASGGVVAEVRGADGTITKVSVNSDQGAVAGKRVSWREILQ